MISPNYDGGAVGLEPTTFGITTRCTCQWRLTPLLFLQSVVIPGPALAFEAEVGGSDLPGHLRRALQADGAWIPERLQYFFLCAAVFTYELIQRHRISR